MGERNDCVEREEHGQGTEPRFEIKLPKAPAADVFGTLLEENPEETG